MTVLAWSDAFDIGVGVMNDEHKVLIEIMNRLHDQVQADASRLEQGKTLDELANYTVEHFANEEVYMESIGYEGIDTHKRIHAKLIEDLGGYKAAFEAGEELSSKFFGFLNIWLRAHIQGIDMKYGGS